MQDFQQLRVWQAALRLTVAIYRATRQFPAEERYGLAAQLRSSAESIGANIAEGCGRGSTADLRRFLHIALGSASEVRHHLIAARAIGYLPGPEGEELSRNADQVARMLNALIARLSPAARRMS